MLGPLLAGDADVVYGSRFLSGHPHRVLYYWHSVGNRLLTTASNMFTNLNLTDMETCYKAFRREVIQSIDDRGGPVRDRARDHREDRRGGLADLRGGDLVLGPDVLRGQEDRLEGRRAGDVRRRALLQGVAPHAFDDRPRARSQHPAGGVRRLRCRALRRPRPRSRKPTTTRTGSTSCRAPPRRGDARDRRGARRAHRTAAPERARHRDRPLQALRGRARGALRRVRRRRRAPRRRRRARNGGSSTSTRWCSSTCSSTSTTTWSALADLRPLLKPGGRICVSSSRRSKGCTPDFDRKHRAPPALPAVAAGQPRSTRPASRSWTPATSTRSAPIAWWLFTRQLGSGADAAVVGEALRPAGRAGHPPARGRVVRPASVSRSSASAGAPPRSLRPGLELERLVLDLGR